MIVLVFCSPSILVFHHFYPNITPGVHRNSNKTKNMHRVRRNSTKRRGSIQIYIDKIKSCICTIVIHYIYNAKYKEDNIQKKPLGRISNIYTPLEKFEWLRWPCSACSEQLITNSDYNNKKRYKMELLSKRISTR